MRALIGWLQRSAIAAAAGSALAALAQPAFELPPVAPVAPQAFETQPVQRFVFEGAKVVPLAELERLAAPFAGRTLSRDDLETLRQRLTRHLVELGYVNSGVLLAEPAVVDGAVRFRVVEGRVKEVRARGMERLHEGYLTSRLLPDEQEVLHVPAMRERFQLLLDDPLFDRANARILPGDAPGDAILDVDVVRARPYQLTLFADNYRPPSIGALGYGLAGWVRNLTGRGDLLETSVVVPEGSSELRGSIGWRVPVFTPRTKLSLQWDHGASSVVEEPLQLLDIRSRIDSKDIGLSHTFIERLDRKLTLGVNYAVRENRTWLLGEPFSFTPAEPDGRTHIRSWSFWQEYTVRSERQVLALRSTFAQARTNLQEVQGLPAGTELPARRYGTWLGQAQYARPVSEQGTQFIGRFSLQHAGHRLPALDQLALGGVSTVRGYRENQLLRDKGFIVNLELDHPVLRASESRVDWSVVPFIDYARGRNHGGSSDTLSSAGLATRLRWQGLSVELAVAKRLQHPSFVTDGGGNLQDKGVHLRVAYQVFGP